MSSHYYANTFSRRSPWLQIACPTCKAQPLVSCATYWGRRARSVHEGRVRLYLDLCHGTTDGGLKKLSAQEAQRRRQAAGLVTFTNTFRRR